MKNMLAIVTREGEGISQGTVLNKVSNYVHESPIAVGVFVERRELGYLLQSLLHSGSGTGAFVRHVSAQPQKHEMERNGSLSASWLLLPMHQ